MHSLFLYNLSAMLFLVVFFVIYNNSIRALTYIIKKGQKIQQCVLGTVVCDMNCTVAKCTQVSVLWWVITWIM